MSKKTPVHAAHTEHRHIAEQKEGSSRFRCAAVAALSLLIVCQLLFIFSNSHKNAEASDAQSAVVVRLAVRVLCGRDIDTMPQNELDTVTHLIRKAAHFTEYACLGALASLWCLMLGFSKKSRIFLGSTAFCFTVGLADELSQCFSDGRACRFTDVLIDTSGGLVAVLVVLCLYRIFTRRGTRKT